MVFSPTCIFSTNLECKYLLAHKLQLYMFSRKEKYSKTIELQFLDQRIAY